MTTETTGTSAPSGTRRYWWVYVPVVIALVAVGVTIFRGQSAREAGMPHEAYEGLMKSIGEHENITVKDLAFTRDTGVLDTRGDQYSGTMTLPNGKPASLKAWVKWYSNAKGGGYVMTWEMLKEGPAATKPAE